MQPTFSYFLGVLRENVKLQEVPFSGSAREEMVRNVCFYIKCSL